MDYKRQYIFSNSLYVLSACKRDVFGSRFTLDINIDATFLGQYCRGEERRKGGGGKGMGEERREGEGRG